MASKREQVLDAVKALVAAALPNADVKRNKPKPDRIPPGGMAIIRDGDPGEPDVTLSPLTYTYSHRISVELAAYESASQSREQVLDGMLSVIGVAVAANRTLGGLCEFLEPEAPAPDDIEVVGALSARWADCVITAVYSTRNPLT